LRYALPMRGLTWIAGALILGASAGLTAAAERPVLVELFTSQGCSSCPPADRFMNELTKRPGVVALTMPVDIWDYLGWKDTFAKHEFSLRQQAYAPGLPSRSVFTPQMVVGGIADVVGSRRDEATGLIDAQANGDVPGATVTLTLSGDNAIIDIPAADAFKDASATVWVARVLSEHQVDIGDGENRGKVIVYSNIVRDLSPAGMWHGEALRLEVPARQNTGETYDRLAVFVQQGETGAVLGAALIDVPLAGPGTP
jgi:hypothetical protein